MAKRKRLTLSSSDTQNALASPGSPGSRSSTSPPLSASRAPIAQMAGDAAAHAALQALTDEVNDARLSGRLVQMLDLEAIREDYIVRDRLVADPEEMKSLKSSLRSRGQQTPLEVVALADQTYGLISGWRRLKALRDLYTETGDARFSRVSALIKPLEDASDSYVAMVEENEIRSDLSFYERARIVAEAVQLGVYPSVSVAIKTLFANTTPSRRSKIASFVELHDAFEDVLLFPTAISEKLGLALVKALRDVPALRKHLKSTLKSKKPDSATAERAILDAALRKGMQPSASGSSSKLISDGIHMEVRKGRILLSGPRVTDELQEQLKAWLKAL